MTAMTAPAPPVRVGLAAVWMTGAIVAFSSLAVAGRALASDLDTFEILAFRSIVGIVLVLVIATATGTRRDIRAARLPLHGLRNMSHFVGQNLWFYAIFTIPLAQVFALEFTQPIWVALAAPLILGERLTAARLGAALIGFMGVLVVAQPQAGGVGAGQAAAALAAVGFAGSALTTKLLTRTEATVSILFWLTVMQAAMGVVCAGWDGDVTLPTAATAPWLTLIACAGLGAHYCLTKALSLAPAGVVIPMDFLRLPVIAAVGALVYGEALSASVALGAALILGANLVNLRGARVVPPGHG
jgi:drug/metabolite transporter (DMT)-like permease